MKNIHFKYLIWCAIFLFQVSCNKPEISPLPVVPAEQAVAPPQPVIVEETIYASATYPGCSLRSVDSEEIGSHVSAYFLRNGTIQWKCLSKPELAPTPVIEFPNSSYTTVSKLTKGTYVFEVTYRTKVGSKQAISTVFVVDDGMPNGALVLPEQEWIKENWSSFPDANYWIYMLDIKNRPDLFCYRQGKNLKVEILDALNNTWREVRSETSDDTDVTRPNPTFFTIEYAYLGIQYDPFYRQDSVMDRLVQQKATLRLSY
jgi:hypothetical protein